MSKNYIKYFDIEIFEFRKKRKKKKIDFKIKKRS